MNELAITAKIKNLGSIVEMRESWPNGTALAWHARGAGFESPRDQNLVLVPSVLSLLLV